MPSNWPQEQRLKFIEHSLLWLRGVTASQVADSFGISRPHAQADITLYREMVGIEAMEYNASSKKHVPTKYFKPLITTSDPIGFIKQGGLSNFQSKIVFSTPSLKRSQQDDLVPLLLTAIDERRDIEVLYASMSTPEGKQRTLQPMALIYCLNRFHLRAYCYDRHGIRDFVLSRILKTPKLGLKTESPKESDLEDWVNLELSVNPHLKSSEAELIKYEFGLAPTKCIRIRNCLISYFLRENFLPSSKEQLKEAKISPKSFPIVATLNGSPIDFI